MCRPLHTYCPVPPLNPSSNLELSKKPRKVAVLMVLRPSLAFGLTIAHSYLERSCNQQLGVADDAIPGCRSH